jgi:hypothetical protein
MDTFVRDSYEIECSLQPGSQTQESLLVKNWLVLTMVRLVAAMQDLANVLET